LPLVFDGASLDPFVLDYYDEGREQSRLRTSSRLEFVRTQELLRRALPSVPARILDVGGGAGAHALPLQQAGYDVALVDPVPLHIEQARAAGIEHAQLGDARSLQYEDAAFDAVLLLGPLYHLPDRTERIDAVREAVRVAGPHGVICAAVISRFASTIDGLHAGFLTDARFERIVENVLETGRHENPDRVAGWFTTAYFHDPEEIRAEFEAAGCAVADLVAIEGPTAGLADIDEWLDDAARRAVLLRAIRRVEREPTLLGASSHLFVVATPRVVS
jgi:SAM-dependent methyltransferase